MPYDEIGRRLGVGGLTVRKWVAAHGQEPGQVLPKHPRHSLAVRDKTAEQIHKGTLTFAQAVDSLGVHESTLRAWVVKYRQRHGLAETKQPSRENDFEAWGKAYRQRRLKELGHLAEQGHDQQPAPEEGFPRQPSLRESQWPAHVPAMPRGMAYMVEERRLRGPG